MTRRAGWALTAALLVLGAIAAPGASAGKPTTTRVDVDETFADAFLSEACGVPVTTRVQGHLIITQFTGGGTGPAELRTLNLVFTATAGSRSTRFRDVGADLVRIEPDGTAVLQIVGRIPFGFTGVLKIDLATGDAILEPQHSLEGDVEKACAALAG